VNADRWQRVGEIYHDALALDDDARPAYLDRSCHGDPDLRREVESLLARAADASDFLETTALELAGRVLAAEPPALTVGQRFDQYEIRAFIGSGGMGEVYRAYDTRLERELSRGVVAEIVEAYLIESLGATRFRRRLSSPRPAPVISRISDPGSGTSETATSP